MGLKPYSVFLACRIRGRTTGYSPSYMNYLLLFFVLKTACECPSRSKRHYHSQRLLRKQSCFGWCNLILPRRTPMRADVDTSESPLLIIYLASFSIRSIFLSQQRYRDYQLIRYRRLHLHWRPHHHQQQQSRITCRKKAFPVTQAIHSQQCSELWTRQPSISSH